MEHLEKLTEIVDKEIGHVVNNGGFRDAQQVHTIYELIDIAKDAMCILDMEEGGSSYADGMGGSYAMRRYEGGSYDGGMSGARGRRGARRDSMGRYSREGGSYRGGYSRADDEIAHNLEKLMNEAPNEEAKEGYRRLLEQMDR
jgi:hypothetical protein